MKLLVTGGCGFLGSNLAAHSAARGDEVWVIDNLSRLGSGNNWEWLKNFKNVNLINVDIRDARQVSDTVQSFCPDSVFHLAGQVAMSTSIKNPRMDFEVNSLGTLNVLEAIRLGSPDSSIIYSSTNKVYGDLLQYRYEEQATRYICMDFPQGFDEKVAIDFHSPYGCSKGSADQYVLDYARIYGLNTVVFRHSSMYGGRQYATADQGWIGWFCQQAIRQSQGDSSPFTISGTGKQVRDVLHADDMVTLYFAALEKIQAIKGQAFNIGGGMENSLSLLELFNILEQRVGSALNYKKIQPRESDQLVFVADLEKAKRLIAWYPKINAIDGIRRMLEWEMR